MEKTKAPPAVAIASTAIPFGVTDLALIGMAVLWGMNFIVVKTSFAEIIPFAFMAGRFLIASVLYCVIVYWKQGGFGVPRRAWAKFALIGIIGTSVYQPLFITGLSMTKASNSSLILASSPAVIALLNHLLGRERFSQRGWIGIFLSFVGIALIVLSSGDLTLDSKALVGDLFVFSATFCWATYSIMMAPQLKKYSSLSITALTTVLGTIPLALIAAPALVAQNWTAVSPAGWAGLFYSGIFAIVISYLIWNLGVQRLGGARTAIYSNVTPVVATLGAALFLSESITLLKIVGAAVIFMGLYLARGAKVIVEPEG
ncbi:MAG TPA: DMT family transporter [Anaerolineae bacterium]|nr:DMT family transporter [Anaerolineae bacterium]